MKIVAIIPARGGSKGLPKKNIIHLLGKPLIAWTIESSLKSKYISKTIVSSDDDDILSISATYGAEVIKRPQELSLDVTASEPVIEHVLNNIKEEYDYFILLQPTSPLRDENDIDGAFDFMFANDASSLISTMKIDNKILKSFIENKDGYLEGAVNNSYPFLRRQDLPDVYLPNGAIYIFSVKEFLANKKILNHRTLGFQMNEDKSLDVDTYLDLKLCEAKLSKY